MGSEYKLHEQGENVLTIYEMSNRFDITTTSESVHPHALEGVTLCDITPKEMMRIMMKGLQVCSYWMEEAEFNTERSKLLKELNL